MLSFKKVVMRKDYANHFPINHFLCQKFDPNTNFHVSIYVTLGANGACHNETKCCLVYNVAQKMKGMVDKFLSQFGKAVQFTGEEGSYCHDAKQFFIFLIDWLHCVEGSQERGSLRSLSM